MLVPLSNAPGVYAIVDDADAALVRQYTWRLDQDGYPFRSSSKGNLHLHRIILPAPPGWEVDHANNNPLDSRRENLRLSNRSLQNRNSRPRGNVPFKGVRATQSGNAIAVIWLDGRDHTIGTFATPEDAARAYDAYARYAFGDRVWRNFPNDPVLTFDQVEALRINPRTPSLRHRGFDVLIKEYIAMALTLGDIERALLPSGMQGDVNPDEDSEKTS